MGTLATRAVAVLALLALLAYPAAALKWQRISTLPALGASVINDERISLWHPSGTGILTLLGPSAQYYTSNNGTTWSILSNLYIDRVFMAGGQAAFGLGQLAKQHDSSKPLDVLRWQKGKEWSVSLKPPAGSGAVGISVGNVLVTDAGKTVFLRGTLRYKSGDLYTSEGPDGKFTQHIWRYTAATNRWASIYKETYTKITAKAATTKMKGGAFTPHLGSLAASSGSLLWAGWAGQDAAGVRLTGRASLWNGASWTVVRQGAANERVTLTGVAPNRAWIAVENTTSGAEALWLYSGAQGAKKLTYNMVPDTRVSAPSTQFAVVSQLVSTAVDPEVLRLWRWDEAAKSFKLLKDVWNVPSGWQVDAASSKWVVLAGVKQDTSTPTPTSRLEAQVWNGSKWTAVTPLKQARPVYMGTLMALPSGGALVCMGDWSGYGLYRLVA